MTNYRLIIQHIDRCPAGDVRVYTVEKIKKKLSRLSVLHVGEVFFNC